MKHDTRLLGRKEHTAVNLTVYLVPATDIYIKGLTKKEIDQYPGRTVKKIRTDNNGILVAHYYAKRVNDTLALISKDYPIKWPK